MQNLDVNNDGKIGYSEFLKAMVNPNQLLTPMNIRAAFDLFDVDGDGEITPVEIEQKL